MIIYSTGDISLGSILLQAEKMMIARCFFFGKGPGGNRYRNLYIQSIE